MVGAKIRRIATRLCWRHGRVRYPHHMRHPYLDGAWAKLERAENQFVQIKQSLLDGFGAGQNPIQRRENSQTGRVAWYWAKGNPNHWVELSLEIGEMFHNLRSCFDHIAWAFGRVGAKHAGKSDPFGNTAFPFIEKKTGWQRSLNNQLRDVPPDGQAFIERFQPYQLRNSSFNRRLDIIRKLNNTDKHALLNIVETSPHSAEYKLFNSGSNVAVKQVSLPLASIQPGNELFSTDGIPVKYDVEVNFVFNHLIEEPREGVRLDIRGDIPRLIRAVRFVVTKADALTHSL